MTAIRVFPHRTSATPDDALAFVGEPPLIRPEADEVLISCSFSWDKAAALHLAEAWGQYYPRPQVGGPALDDPGGEFTPGLFLKQGITITSRGCPHECSFCLVPKREGKTRELEVKPGYIIQDNNLLRCSSSHRQTVFAMLRQQSRAAIFRGGLEPAAITDEVAEELLGLRIHEVWLAADYDGALQNLRRAVLRLKVLGRGKLRCYVLIGYWGETIQQAESRLLAVWEAGCLPFAQLYRDENDSVEWSREWRNLARVWSRPAATKAMMMGLSVREFDAGGRGQLVPRKETEGKETK